MAKAKKLPSGSWRVLIYDYTDRNGKRHYQSFTSTDPSPAGRREVEKQAAEFAYEKENRLRSDKTFGQALEEYIVKREPVVSPRTIMSYRRIQRNDLKCLDNVKIRNINQELIQEIINEDAKKHSPKTVRDNHGLISAVLKQEIPSFTLNTILPKNKRPNIYIPSDDDVKKLIAYVQGSELELPILLAAFGPMRRGEISALYSDDIKGNIVHVCRNMVRNEAYDWIIKQPKSFAGDRFIEYPEFVANKWTGLSGRIVLLSPDNISSRFARTIKNINIPHFRFHDLRHYSASIQHALGIPDAYIMQRGGWGNDGVLKTIYRHAMTGQTEYMNKIANSHFTNMQHEMQHEKKEP